VTTPAQPPAPPPRPAGGGNILTRKIGPIPGWGWLVIVAAGAGVFIWWRSKKASAAAAASSSSGSSGTSASSAGPTQATCYDANGNTVACSDPSAVGSNATDYFEALYAQNEGINGQLETITPTIDTTGQDVGTIEAQLQNLGGSTSTGTGASGTPGPVTDITVATPSPTLAVVSWRPPQYASHAPTATTYTIQVTPKDSAPHNIGSRTSYNVGGLKAGTSYTAMVAPAGGPSASKTFKTPAAKATPTPRKAA
jgi:hypothetical protein